MKRDFGDLRDEVRELRKHLGMTQEQFAQAIGKTTPSVQYYERLRPPIEPDVLAILCRLSEDHGLPELEVSFRRALMASLGEDVTHVLGRGTHQQGELPPQKSSGQVLELPSILSENASQDFRTCVALLYNIFASGSSEIRDLALGLLKSLELRAADEKLRAKAPRRKRDRMAGT